MRIKIPITTPTIIPVSDEERPVLEEEEFRFDPSTNQSVYTGVVWVGRWVEGCHVNIKKNEQNYKNYTYLIPK